MIQLPDTIIKEATVLQNCLERGQLNINELLSFFKKISGIKPERETLSAIRGREAEMFRFQLKNLNNGHSKNFFKQKQNI